MKNCYILIYRVILCQSFEVANMMSRANSEIPTPGVWD